ncbi:hypothetical protein HNP77_001787 [Treponema rectale]|uniref:Uncharacterized protein n=1 Tax=Treponema rectale TaxID=744512 RepID=A0A840SGY5_9SPIR|nr:hypothetical protein [Treponema rectale]
MAGETVITEINGMTDNLNRDMTVSVRETAFYRLLTEL